MQKREWDRCNDTDRMVREVCFYPENERRMRLFTLAASKRLLEQLESPVCHSAVEVAWRLADGSATNHEIDKHFENLAAVCGEASAVDSWQVARFVHVLMMLFRSPPSAALELIRPGTMASNCQPFPLLAPTEIDACRGLLRDIFRWGGDPIHVAPGWLAWNDRTVSKLAQAIYDEHAFRHMPVLADALEEAGCTNSEVLKHCREPGPHVRGCWSVDLLLGKE